MKPAILYAAKSTEDTKGSIPTQLEDGRALAEREGLTVLGEYRDEAKSAYHGNRGDGLASAVADCERLSTEHGRAYLIVQHSDRLARGNGKDAKHLTEYAIWALKKDVRIMSVQDPGTFPEGENALLMAAVTGQRNTEDSKRKALAVSDGLKRRVKDGRALGGPCRYGYRRLYRPGVKDGTTESYLVLDDEHAAVIRRICDEYASGGTHRSIAAGLVRDDIPAPKGGKWSQATVKAILHSKFYLGVLVDKEGNEIPAEHPAIIDRNTYDRVQAASCSQARRTGGRHAPGAHLFTRGLLKCGKCGSTMFPRKNRDRDIYYCGGRSNLGVEFCDQPSLDREVVDGAFMAYLTKHLLDVAETRRQVQERIALEITAASNAVRTADEQAARADARLSRVRRDYQDGKLAVEDYNEMRAELAPELEAAQHQAKQARAKLKDVQASHSETDTEAETLRLVGDYQALASSIEQAKTVDIKALRMTLRQAFAAVVYTTAEALSLPEVAGVPTGAHGAKEAVFAGTGLLIPMLTPDSIIGIGADDRPEVQRVPVPLAQLIEHAPVNSGLRQGRGV